VFGSSCFELFATQWPSEDRLWLVQTVLDSIGKAGYLPRFWFAGEQRCNCFGFFSCFGKLFLLQELIGVRSVGG